MSRKRKQSESETVETEPQQPQTSWITLATEDEPKLAVPIGTRFQVDLPIEQTWSMPLQEDVTASGSGTCSMPLQEDVTASGSGTCSMPLQEDVTVSGSGTCSMPLQEDVTASGSGTCSCSSPGSVECIEYHVNQERNMLEAELGPAYQLWRFHEIGNVVAESWTKQEEETFHRIVKENPISAGDGFMKSALRALPLKNRASIISYYLNVYVPRRICKQTRSGYTKIDTDDDEEEDSKTVDTRSRKGKAPAITEINSSRSRSYLSGCR